jgi:MFS family permease
MPNNPNSPGIEWRNHWTVVLAAFFGVSLGSLHVYSTGLFIQPLEQELEWSRSKITSGLTLVSLMGVLFSPFVGILIDRWGPRRLAVPGAALFCLAFAGLSLARGPIWTWWGLWLLIATLALALKPTIWSAAISSHFSKSRGLALAIAFCGTGFGSTIIPLLADHLINELGWRGAYMALGGIFFVGTVPLLFIFFHDAKSSKAKALNTREQKPPIPLSGWSVGQGLRSRQFFQLALSALLITAVIVGLVVHIVPLLSDAGLPRQTVVKIASLIGVTSIVGRLTVGYLFDRLPGPPVGMISVGLPMVAAAIILLFPGSLAMSVIAVIFLGLSVGGEYDAIIYLSTRYFGLKNFGTLFGFVTSLLLAGVGLGPLFGGLLYDLSGDYTLFLIAVIPLSAVTCILLGTLGPYPDHETISDKG